MEADMIVHGSSKECMGVHGSLEYDVMGVYHGSV